MLGVGFTDAAHPRASGKPAAHRICGVAGDERGSYARAKPIVVDASGESASADRRKRAIAMRDASRAHRELADDEARRRLEDDLAGEQILAAVQRMEMKTQRALDRAVGVAQAEIVWRKHYDRPTLRTARGLNGQLPLLSSSRPANARGETSFHFDVTSIAKGDELRAALADPTQALKAKSVAAKFQEYLEREDAIERGQAVAAQGYIENDAKIERDFGDLHDGPTFASFGTLPSDREARGGFFQIVEDNERVPRVLVILDPKADPAVTARVKAKLDEDGDADEHPLSPTIRACLDADEAMEIAVEAADALELIARFHSAGQVDSFAAPQRTKGLPSPLLPPRPLRVAYRSGGTIQIRVIIELPREMTPRQRLNLAKDYCAEFGRQGLMYWAVIHAPGPTNDPRNVHLHVNLYDRPCRQIDVAGQQVWDFAYSTRHPDPKQARDYRPYKQRKIRGFAKKDWIRIERSRFAKLATEHMKTAGIARGLNPNRHVLMDIAQVPRRRLAKSDYNRERRGIATTAGDAMVKTEWDEELVAISRRAQNELQETERPLDTRIGAIEEMTSKLAHGAPDAEALQVMLTELRNTQQQMARALLDRHALPYVAERLGSRARLVPAALQDASLRLAANSAGELTHSLPVIVAEEQALRLHAEKQFDAIEQHLSAALVRQNEHVGLDAHSGVHEGTRTSAEQRDSLVQPAAPHSMRTEISETALSKIPSSVPRSPLPQDRRILMPDERRQTHRKTKRDVSVEEVGGQDERTRAITSMRRNKRELQPASTAVMRVVGIARKVHLDEEQLARRLKNNARKKNLAQSAEAPSSNDHTTSDVVSLPKSSEPPHTAGPRPDAPTGSEHGENLRRRAIIAQKKRRDDGRGR
jgi:MobA/MobL family